MAAGAEKRLEDYHFLRNTYETVSTFSLLNDENSIDPSYQYRLVVKKSS